MVRKMAGIGFSYLAGLFFASFLHSAACIYIGISVIAVTVLYLVIQKRNRFAALCICSVSFAAGSIYYGVYSSAVYEDIVRYDGYDVKLEGSIVSFNEYGGDMSSYTIKGIINDDVKAEVNCFADSAECSIGDNVSITSKAHKLSDTYTFPAESYYKAKGIYLEISDLSDFEIIEDNSFSLYRTVDSYRKYIFSVINKILPDDESSVISAILLGEKSGIADYQTALMFRAGIGHIMAVSGAHLAIVCAFFQIIISRLPLNKYFRFILLMLPVLAFVLLAGMSGSVIRSAVMVIIVYSSQLFRRQADTFNSLGIAVILLTLPCPFAVKDASFLMSAGGVFGIGVIAPEIIRLIEDYINSKTNRKHDSSGGKSRFRFGKASYSLISCACTTCVLFPVSFLFFDEISVISPVSNLLLIPLCTFIMVCGLIVTVSGGLYFIAYPVLKTAGICCRVVIIISEFIGNLRFSYIPLGYDFIRYVIIVCFLVIIAGALIMRHFKSVTVLSLCLFSFSMAVISIYKFIPDGSVTAAVLKEKSSSVLIIHDKKTASIVDLNRGGKSADSAVKYLNKLGIYEIDSLCLNADSLTSIPVYKERLKLFDVNNVLIPDGDYFASGNKYLGENTFTYGKNGGGSRIVMPYYSLDINNNYIELLYNDNRLVFYDGNSKEPGFKRNDYNAAVMFDGKEMTAVPSNNFIVLNEEAVVPVGKADKAYIGQSVRMTSYKNGSLNLEVIEIGSNQ